MDKHDKLHHRIDKSMFGDDNKQASDAIESGLVLDDESEAIKVLNRLRSLGAQIEVDLPTIALCGQQSCGKSSLTEAISGVAMPRAAGTCTRCPTELRLIQTSQDSKWECKIGIRIEYDDVKQQPLQRVTEIVIGCTSDRSQVTSLVEQAQNKILKLQNVKFSRNFITVEVYSSDVLNLTIVDMPGLIFATEDPNDAQYIQLVKKLVIDTISKPNTLIACVVSCKDDMENQMINQLAREYDPKGDRTIGILTKVDTIETGLEASWINVLKNQKYPLKLGYVAIRNPSQNELNKKLSYIESRGLENKFFAETAPWKTFDGELKNRLGSKNLVRILSDTLGKLIIRQLPKLSKQIEKKISHVQKKLSKLPGGIEHKISPIDTVCDMLVQYTDESKNLVRMKGSKFWKEVMIEYQKYFNKMQNFAPQFVVSKEDSVKNGNNTRRQFQYTMKNVVYEQQKCRRAELQITESEFVTNSRDMWEMPAREIVLASARVFQEYMSKQTLSTFEQYPMIYKRISAIVRQLINELTQETIEHGMELLRREYISAFTMTSHVFTSIYESTHRALSKKFGDCTGSYEENMGLMIMAKCAAYYDVSCSRFCDVLLMGIEDKLYHGFCRKIDFEIRNKLSLLNRSNETCSKWLIENAGIAKNREELKAQLQRLQDVATELRLVVPATDFDEFELDDMETEKNMNASSDMEINQMNEANINANKLNKLNKFNSDNGMLVLDSREPSADSAPGGEKKKRKKKWF